MTIKKHLGSAVTGVTLLVTAWLAHPGTTPSFAQEKTTLSSGSQTQPNIIFIMFDDLDYFDLGAYGHPGHQTPVIDQAASEGLMLTNYYATPLCPPTRHSLMTGDYPSRHGIKRLPPFSTKGIAEDLVLPQILQSYGYTTAHVGKWHLGHFHDEYLPHNKGYDTSLVGKGYVGTVEPDYATAELLLDGVPVPPTQHVTAALTDFTLDFIENNQAGPFFVNLWLFTPHTPLECPTDFLDVCGEPQNPTDAELFKAMIENADIQLGRIFDKLEALGIEQNTLVVITSDNGGTVDTQSAVLPPIRGSKTDVFERGIKVPFIAWGPSLVEPGQVNDSVVVSLDMAPTFEQLARPEDIIADIPFDGVSVLDLLTATTPETQPRDGYLFWELNHRDNDNYPPPSGWYQNFAVRQGDWKLVMELNHKSNWAAPKLFDLTTNPGEKVGLDLSSQFPKLADEMLAAYWAWREETGSVSTYIQATDGSVIHSGGPTSKTFLFTGGGGHVDLQDRKIFDFGDGDFSIEMTVRFDEVGTSPVLVKKTESWVVSLDAQNRLRFRVVGVPADPSDPAPIAIVNSDTPLSAGVDYHVALTISGFRTDNSTIRMYIDGVEQSGTDCTLPRVAVSPDPIRIGNNHESPPNRPFKGQIRDLTFYLHALTPFEAGAPPSTLPIVCELPTSIGSP